MTERSEQEHATSDGISKPLPTEISVKLSRDLPSNSLPGIRAARRTPPSGLSSTNLSDSEPRFSLTPTAPSISKSRSASKLQSHSRDRYSITTTGPSPSVVLDESNEERRQTVIRSFAPRVAVYASTETEVFVKHKGFEDGLYGLLRPYGERLSGKVIIRDSVGGSKGWDDFGIIFTDSRDLQKSGTYYSGGGPVEQDSQGLVNGTLHDPEHRRNSLGFETPAAVDKVLDRYVQAESGASGGAETGYLDFSGGPNGPQASHASLHTLYLRKLLSSAPIAPYEMFSHPVACVIAVSSRNPAPIEALRQLYASTSHGNNRTPAWVGTEYLRYYVLIHDEENDDITKSTALFDLMKRHFGLHCHLLRLRSSQCVETDDDSTQVPSCEWLSAEEELRQAGSRDYTDDVDGPERYIVESDATAIKALLREMVTQSIVPFMESRVMTWNDQIASRRRGISGRFMSLSKRWTGFGSAKGATSGQSASANSPGSNYDHQRGFYPPDTPEATMRLLGDYAFMLRDWKLAYNTYDFLRSDFSHDKAWRYHAAANEMAALTSLLIPQTMSSRSRAEAVDQMLDTAAYSYLTRCSMPYGVIRCLTLAMELLKSRGPTAADDAARWGGKLLELSVLSPIAQALTAERIAECYISRSGVTLPTLGTRRRQAALWNILASSSWISFDNPNQARRSLQKASVLYGLSNQKNAGPPFPSMQAFWQRLDYALRTTDTNGPSELVDAGINDGNLQSSTVEDSEPLNAFTRPFSVDEIDTEGFTPQDAGRPDPASFGGRQLREDGFG